MFLRNVFYRTLAAALCLLLAGADSPVLFAQAAPVPPRLLITILDGEDALNNIKQRTAREPIIEVTDENHKPVAGVAVLFLLPDSGPGGLFLNGARTFSTTTDAAGRAVAQGLKPNHLTGNFEIRVKVNYNGANAETSIHQTNISGQSTTVQRAGHVAPVKGILIAVGVAAATGGLILGVLSTRNGRTTTITPGTPTVGAP